MKRIILGSLATIAMSVSLSAAVYATVDGVNVTDQDIGQLLRAIPGAKYDAMKPDDQKRVLNQAIERKLLSKNAIKSGIESDSEFKKQLEKLKGGLALEIWMKKIFDKVTVAESDVKAYYDKNADKFIKPQTAKARHILLKTKKEAEAVIAELKGLSGDALKKKFIELAKSKSTGPSAKNGGDLGWFNARQMVAPFSKATFAQAKGEVTKTPVKTQFGYHVILTEDKKGGEKVSFATAKIRIENALKMKKFRDDVAKTAKDLRKKAKIVLK
jgi:parvulin-like peptidyl-prolyl isomerase